MLDEDALDPDRLSIDGCAATYCEESHQAHVQVTFSYECPSWPMPVTPLTGTASAMMLVNRRLTDKGWITGVSEARDLIQNEITSIINERSAPGCSLDDQLIANGAELALILASDALSNLMGETVSNVIPLRSGA